MGYRDEVERTAVQIARNDGRLHIEEFKNFSDWEREAYQERAREFLDQHRFVPVIWEEND